MARIAVIYAGDAPQKLLEKAAAIHREGDDVIIVYIKPAAKIRGFEHVKFDEESPETIISKAMDHMKKIGIESSALIAYGDVVEETINICGEIKADIVVLPGGDIRCGKFHIENLSKAVMGKIKAVIVVVD